MVCLFVLSMLVTAAFALAALPILLMSEVSATGGLSNALNQPLVATLVAIVLLGPLVEEVIFRGWLSGTWQALIGSAALLVMFYMGPTLTEQFFEVSTLMLQIFFAALGVTILYALSSNNLRSQIKGYSRIFPLLFWGQGVLFGILHFRNLYSDTIALPLLMTLPLVICGWIWAYARVTFGLPSAVLLHMAYNVPSAAGLVLVAAFQTG